MFSAEVPGRIRTGFRKGAQVILLNLRILLGVWQVDR
jgi:hypothetical protein